MKVLGEFKSVTNKTYRKKDGSFGVCHPAVFAAGDDLYLFSIFRGEDYMKVNNITVGTIGTLELQFDLFEKLDQNGEKYLIQRIDFKAFRAANASLMNQQQQPTAAEQAPVAEAQPVPQPDLTDKMPF